jgi:hypothetical protein
MGGGRDQFLVLDPEGSLRATFAEPLFAYRIAWNQKSNLVAAISLEHRSQQFVLEYWPMGTQRFTIVEHLEKPSDYHRFPSI